MANLNGFCNDPQSVLGSATKTRNMVSNESTQHWHFDNPQAREGKLAHPSCDLGSLTREDRPNQTNSPMYPMPNVLIVDFTGFKLDKDFFIKELAFYNPFAVNYWVATFQQPFAKSYCKRKMNNMINSHSSCHGLSWDEGQYPFHMLPQILNYFASTHTIYIQGLQKCQWLQQLTSFTISSLDCMNFPSSDTLPLGSYCSFHDSTQYSCALDNAVKLGHCFVQMYSFKPL